MARPPRTSYPGAVHHVTARGVGRVEIFGSDRDYEVFLATLVEAGRLARWSCLSYCLMPNHFHLLLARVDTAGLSSGMQFLNGTYASRYNTAHERTGHVFQGRFHDELVRRDEHLLEAIRYIALNPVRGGLVPRAELWRWSSHRAIAGAHSRHEWLHEKAVLGLFNADEAVARRLYAEFVAAGAHTTGRPSLGTLIDDASGAGVASARDDYSYTQAEIAAHLGVSQPTISRMIRRDRSRE
ncbi:MAG TPA: transposase [Gaiellales bacterium]|nr:transposase [Gaiellales bacterium]